MTRFALFVVFAFLISSAAIAQQIQQDQPTAPASAPVRPGVTSVADAQVQEFQKVENAWSDAVNRRDQYGLELSLSPLFVDVSASGDVTTRNQQVATLISSEDKTARLEQKVVTVRMLGDIAITNGTYSYAHKSGSSPVMEKGVFTHVFQRVHNNWQCVNSQRTQVRADSPTTAEEKPKKKSNAAMPFHIPLFSK